MRRSPLKVTSADEEFARSMLKILLVVWIRSRETDVSVADVRVAPVTRNVLCQTVALLIGLLDDLSIGLPASHEEMMEEILAGLGAES
jgi:hypothetical protein